MLLRCTLLLGAAACAALFGQSPLLYPFGFDQDALSGPVDFSFLNHPLTSDDRVTVRDGQFVTAAKLERIRFFGVNLAFGANFPTREDSVRIARRLRRLGVNLVRLHHMDSSPDSNAASANSLLTTGPYPSWNEVSLTRLRDFLTALSAEGIYANLNLHVGYAFRPAIDNVPAGVPSQSKPLHIFYPRMVDLQRRYAEELLDRLQLRDDPVLAMVEINNESSLIHAWQSSDLEPALTGDYLTALQSQWNRFLAAKYKDTAELQSAWGSGSLDGPELLNGRYQLEVHSPAAATLSTAGGIAQVHVTSGGNWVFLKQTGFQLAQGKRYVWRFSARADLAAGKTASVPITVMRDVSPWDGFLYSSITLTNQWQTYTIAATPSFDIGDSGRVSLDVQAVGADVQVKDMSLVEAGQKGLASGETLEAAHISLLGAGEGATPARLRDYTAFLADVDRQYVNTIRDSVRSRLGPLTPITGTQMGYGGPIVLDTQADLDYQDNHFYIDHYAFPNVSWDGFDWRISDRAAADDNWAALQEMAWSREVGRPFTVSEFNQPWPNTHAAEIDPTLAAFAAFQDWDGILHFAYAHSRGWDDGVPEAFNINGDWTKLPVIGQSAWLFRTGAVHAAADRVVAALTAEQRLQAAPAARSFRSLVSAPERSLKVAVGVTRDSSLASSSATDGNELIFDGAKKLLCIQAPMAAGVIGQVSGVAIEAGALTVETKAPFLTLLATARDGRPLGESTSILLSVPGYTLRSMPGAPPPREQRLVYYPGTANYWTAESSNSRPSGDLNSGQKPTYLQRIEVWVTLRTRAVSLRVAALDGAGGVLSWLPDSDVVKVDGGYRLHLNAPSPWYAIEAAQPAAPTITADPNPIPVTEGMLGQTTLTWNAPGYPSVEIRVGAPDGPAMAFGGEQGSAQTGEWVGDGTEFFLVDSTNGKTLASVVLRLQQA